MPRKTRSDQTIITDGHARIGLLVRQCGPHSCEVQLDDGRRLIIPRELLSEQPDGSMRLPGGLLHRAASDDNEEEHVNLAVAEERLVVDKQQRQTGRVVVHVVPTEHQETVDVPLAQETVEIRRVRKDEFVQAAPDVRREGDEIVVPVVEEVLEVRRRLMLREEVRISRVRTTRHEPQHVTLRSQQVHVERNRPTQP